MDKLIITVAPTGSVPTKDMNPNLPITPAEIGADAARCQDAGASIIHIHAREDDGTNSTRRERFAEIVAAVEARAPRLIRQISTGGRAGAGLDVRLPRLELNPEMASLTTGSVNFPNMVYENPPDLIDGLAAEMKERGVKPEMECFDLSMISNADDLQRRGLAEAPLHFNLVMGLKGAITATARNLVFMVDSLPAGSSWCVSGMGRFQLPLAVHAILMGGHVRVGLEDNIWYVKGRLASNPELVERIVRLAKELGREVADPEEAREILSLPLQTNRSASGAGT